MIKGFKRAYPSGHPDRKKYIKLAAIDVLQGLFVLATLGYWEWTYLENLHTKILFDDDLG